MVQASLGINMRPNSKIKVKRTGGVAEVVEHLPSKCDVLSSNPNAQKSKFSP
jgi:hypothetical protein